MEFLMPVSKFQTNGRCIGVWTAAVPTGRVGVASQRLQVDVYL